MYRVELKAKSTEKAKVETGSNVPNVPCGVERIVYFSRDNEDIEFLMYRVELKGF